MIIKQFAKDLKATVADIKSKGTTSILCDNLIAYLDHVITSPQPDEYERFNAELARHAEFEHQGNVEKFKAVTTAGQNAIKTSMLLNGGAAVAMLAFIGHLATTKPDKVSLLAPTILPFALGAFFVGITSGATYLSQFLLAREKTEKAGIFMNFVCIGLGGLSFAAFLWGLLQTYCILGRAF